MARRIEQIDHVAIIWKLHDRRCHRDAALLLQRHPVRRRMATRFSALDGTGKLYRAAVEQQLFGERRLARVRMRNDRERTAPADFLVDIGH